jgi:hypothetical protein
MPSDADRRAAARDHGDLGDVVEALDQPETAHDVHLGSVLDVGAAGVAVALREGVEHLRQRQRVGLELQRVDVHLVLFRRPAEAHDVDDTRHRPQLPLHDPVLEGFQLER